MKKITLKILGLIAGLWQLRCWYSRIFNDCTESLPNVGGEDEVVKS
jgi:hypothetical protein